MLRKNLVNLINYRFRYFFIKKTTGACERLPVGIGYLVLVI